MKRLAVNILILLLVFIFPPYISALIIAGLIFVFDNFIESIVWAYIIDTMYGGGFSFGLHFQYILTVFMIVVYIASFQFKKSVKFY